MNKIAYINYVILISFGLFSHPAFSAPEGEFAEFDPGFIYQADKSNTLDLTQFNYGNPIIAGSYSSDVFVNDVFKSKKLISFVDNPADASRPTLCLDRILVRSLDIKSQYLDENRIGADESACIDIEQLLPKSTVKFDMSVQRLDIIVPQIYLEYRPRGYINPSEWESGVSSAFVAYQYNHYQSRTSNYKRSNRDYLNIRAGLNIAGWYLRHMGSYSNSDSVSEYHSVYTYIQRDIPAWRGQLKLGDLYTGGYLFDSTSMRGIQIQSDERMLPSSMRGYAPVIRGIAGSSANISVHQRGYEIYNINVPAGEFIINDLYPSSYNGDLDVTVTEADGSVRTFSVPFGSSAQLLRYGMSKYDLSVGFVLSGNRALKKKRWLERGNMVQAII